MVWASMPAGCYMMGCSPGDQCLGDEHPAHAVVVSDFEMLETEVTQNQFAAVMGQLPPNIFECPSCPIDNVRWDEAEAFCLSVGGRLPTEAEWEYAARGGTTTKYYCGDQSSCLEDIAWYSVTAQGPDSTGNRPQPVRGKASNHYGLYDMLGNASEWVKDCKHQGYTGAPSAAYPAWGDCNEMNIMRGSRGGSFSSDETGTRVSHRGFVAPDFHVIGHGFRCAR